MKGEKEIVDRFKQYKDKDSVREFFALLNELITQLGLEETDERLTLNTRNDDRKRISVSLNSRLVFGLVSKQPADELVFMLYENDAKGYSGLKDYADTNFHPTSGLAPAKPYILTFQDFRKLDHAFTERWLKCCADYLPSQEKSQYRSVHVPMLYDLAFNQDRLEKLLTMAFDEASAPQHPYFDLHGLAAYRNRPGTTYDANTAAANWYKDTVTKLEYFGLLLAESLQEDLYANYRERPNGQGGPGKIIFKEYALIGFAPTGYFENGDVFIKMAFCDLTQVPMFEMQLDINFKNKDNRFNPTREEIRDASTLRIPVDDNFPQDWDSLKKRFIDHARELVKRIKNYSPMATATTKQTDMHPDQPELNTILYGPPGTGKTYTSKELAVRTIMGKDTPVDRPEIIKKYEEYYHKGQIAYTTFHQSMSYEDFIEGIKPLKPEGEGEVTYDVVPGIFKRLCERASGTKSSSNFDEAYESFTNDVQENGSIDLETPKLKKKFKVTINSLGNCMVKPYTEAATAMTVTKEMIKTYLFEGKITDWKPYTIPLSEHLRTKYNVKTEEKSAAENYVMIIDEINRGNVANIFGELITLIEKDKRTGETEAIRMTLPYSKEKGFTVPPNLYIIGTMNTADRSVEALDTALRRRFSFKGVFPDVDLVPTPGKLINELWFRYFPNNNTQTRPNWNSPEYLAAEQSVFSFIGIDPEFAKTKREIYNSYYFVDADQAIPRFNTSYRHTGINLPLMFSVLNRRIEKLIDKDHCIGHYYFMELARTDTPESVLRKIFSDKIIPLLCEYFYGDFGKVELVIGKDFFEGADAEEEDAEKFFADSDHEAKNELMGRRVYRFADIMDSNFNFIEAVKKIYQPR